MSDRVKITLWNRLRRKLGMRYTVDYISYLKPKIAQRNCAGRALARVEDQDDSKPGLRP